jgi:hypothetical protein
LDLLSQLASLLCLCYLLCYLSHKLFIYKRIQI